MKPAWYTIPLVVAGVAGVGLALTFNVPPIDSVQHGYRGLGMVQLFNPRTIAAEAVANKLPDPIDPVPPAGTLSSAVYQNVQVLGNVDSDEFIRLMTAITEWVAPVQGCSYCHADGEELSADTLYTKVVARRMLQMTQNINSNWKPHVGATGVTCYTCHRGQPVPNNIWFENAGPPRAAGMSATNAGQNHPDAAAGLASLPYDPFTPFLDQDKNIRVISTTPLPEGNRSSIKQTEWTYALMMHFSESLGVNCTYCHNSRSFSAWDQSTPQRSTAWYGIRMVRDVNADYLTPLTSVFPHNRLGPLGDAPKVACATCHQGVYKPLFGASMLKDFPELAGPTQEAMATPAVAPAAEPAPAAAPTPQ